MKKTRWQIIKKWIIRRLREKTTWLGLFGIFTAFAILPFDEQVTGYIATFLASFGGLLGVLWQEEPKKKNRKKSTVAKAKTVKTSTVKIDTDESDDSEGAKIKLH